MKIQVKDFMFSPVLTALTTEKVTEVQALMERNKVHALPVIEISKQLPKNEVTIRGILTSTDFGKPHTDDTTAEELMTPKVHVLHQDSSVQSAARLMLRHEVHHLVVMHDGEIVGMVSSVDMVKLVAEHGLAG